jgi:hypothetical protein
MTFAFISFQLSIRFIENNLILFFTSFGAIQTVFLTAFYNNVSPHTRIMNGQQKMLVKLIYSNFRHFCNIVFFFFLKAIFLTTLNFLSYFFDEIANFLLVFKNFLCKIIQLNIRLLSFLWK